ncbi:MAG TPA: hypothetical protein VGK63_06950 [Candidatus Limnocylindrales bacterium]
MTGRLRSIGAAPLYVALAGLASLRIRLGSIADPLVVAWVFLIAAIWLASPLVRGRGWRLLSASAMVVITFLALWEGGWYLLPAAAIELGLEVRGWLRDRDEARP